MANPRKKKGAGMWRYLKEAFKYHWNVLLFGGAAAAALIAGSPDIALPLVAAAELVYLTGLTANPRFQAAIDAKVHRENAPAAGAPERAKRPPTRELLDSLDAAARNRFMELRQSCRSMTSIAKGVAGASVVGGRDLDTAKLDRLLWGFLRLLHSQRALGHFLASTDRDSIAAELTELEAHSQRAAAEGDDRILKSLTDSIATAQLRLSNYDRAEKNAEFVRVELNRIEGKIRALSEMAVGTEDPDYISSQVDSVAESMASTEMAIREMRSLTGLIDEMEQAPSIMNADLESDEAVEYVVEEEPEVVES